MPLAKEQFPVDRAGMFCFSLMLPFGYEVDLLAWQYAHQAGWVTLAERPRDHFSFSQWKSIATFRRAFLHVTNLRPDTQYIFIKRVGTSSVELAVDLVMQYMHRAVQDAFARYYSHITAGCWQSFGFCSNRHFAIVRSTPTDPCKLVQEQARV